ncbi:MBL fold metallo-hydrolase [Maribacter sp. 2-571]|uniref:MBL fold metallo-hydrolase n=1 Tax=Maribacter sp. 2-571 TaxID=3417569 RepID=UPI003D34A8D6
MKRSLLKNLLFLLLLGINCIAVGAQDTQQLPETSYGPAIDPAKGYLVAEIDERLYWVTDGLYNAMFLVYDEGVIAVDAPPTIGQNYLKAIAEVTEKPVTHLVYSHSHTDHIGAAGLFPKGIEIVAHEDTKAILERRKDPRRPIPTKVFEKNHEIVLGDQLLRLTYHGKNHIEGNIFIHAPKQKVLMLVDVIFPGWVPFKNLGIAEDVPGYMEAHDIALDYDFETFIAGHVTRLGNRADVEVSKAFVTDLKETAQQAFGKVDFMKSAQETGFEDKWKMYNTYFEKVVDVATAEMKKKWDGKLGGIDTYLRDDVWAMCESLSVDF